jgi:hypothetical protein
VGLQTTEEDKILNKEFSFTYDALVLAGLTLMVAIYVAISLDCRKCHLN